MLPNIIASTMFMASFTSIHFPEVHGGINRSGFMSIHFPEVHGGTNRSGSLAKYLNGRFKQGKKKTKHVCFLLHLQKNKVGRSLLLLFFIIFPDFTKKHNICVVCTMYITKRALLGYLLKIQNACPTVKAFHRMNLNQNKCLNTNTASNMTAKVAKLMKNGRK